MEDVESKNGPHDTNTELASSPTHDVHSSKFLESHGENSQEGVGKSNE